MEFLEVLRKERRERKRGVFVVCAFAFGFDLVVCVRWSGEFYIRDVFT